MNKLTEQIIALSGVFTSANLVHNFAVNEQLDNEPASCLIKSLTVINPAQTLDVFAGSYAELKPGIIDLQNCINRNYNNALRHIMQYSFVLLKLESMLSNQQNLLQLISNKLPYIENQGENFGWLNANVMEACSDLYQQTLSTLPQRINVIGNKDFLQIKENANIVRTLLLTGIRCARLWRQLGASRWHLLFKRRQILQELDNLLA